MEAVDEAGLATLLVPLKATLLGAALESHLCSVVVDLVAESDGSHQKGRPFVVTAYGFRTAFSEGAYRQDQSLLKNWACSIPEVRLVKALDLSAFKAPADSEPTIPTTTFHHGILPCPPFQSHERGGPDGPTSCLWPSVHSTSLTPAFGASPPETPAPDTPQSDPNPTASSP